MKRYISEIINEEEINEWKENERILICSPTGTGKTQLVFTALYNYCAQNKKKLLLLSNRRALKTQNEADFDLNDCDPEILTIKNYQGLESEKLNYSESYDVFEKYNFVVFDECHYFFVDSFNNNSDILLANLNPQQLGIIFIFITATPGPIYKYQPEFSKVYELKNDFSFIEKISFYSTPKALDSIFCKIPKGHKTIYMGKIDTALSLSKKIEDSRFLCSKENLKYAKFSDKYTYNEILSRKIFTCRHLFCTQVLDNGISLIDLDLKHIIIDQVNITTLVQFLGRKRIHDGEKIFLYLRDFDKRTLNGYLSKINNSLERVNELMEFGKEEYLKRNKRFPRDPVIFGDGTINHAVLAHLEYQQEVYLKMKEEGYRNYICNLLNHPVCDSVLVDKVEGDNLTQSMLDNYLEQPIDKDGQKEFKKIFFEIIFAPKRNDPRNHGLCVINSILGENQLGYKVISKKITDNGKRKTVWVVIKVDN